MTVCEHQNCGDNNGFTVSCNFCGGKYCTDHRLPEKHSCDRIETVTAATVGRDQVETMSKSEINRRSRKANKRQCEECGDYTTGDNKLCIECRSAPSVSESLQSPDVREKGPDASESSISTGERSTVRKVLILVKIRLETIFIRIRAWINTVIQAVAIGVFLLGVYAIWTFRTLTPLEPIELFGYPVPSLFGFHELEVLFYGGIITMIVGLAISMKLITGRATPR